MSSLEILKRICQPLASRKMRVALATVLAGYLVRWIPGATEEAVYTVLGVGVALILGIAHEDNGAKAGTTVTTVKQPGQPTATATAVTTKNSDQ